ncbi:MAG: glyoxalase/bleomycin resistance/extradiol dioxygenase family protein [Acidimicrobiia bacterium]|nr:glyoxalase/bleomycin resistance/extradiol dioxygenase family protein [Acidimicrobiia bacterium]
MSRVQLALNVTDLDAAIDYYSKLFSSSPAKVRPGYANFAIDEPALKLVLIENSTGGSLNHLGVEVEDTAAVDRAMQRVSNEGVEITKDEREVACCYATQDKFWTEDPDGLGWEVYTVLADAEVMASTTSGNVASDACCGGTAAAACC